MSDLISIVWFVERQLENEDEMLNSTFYFRYQVESKSSKTNNLSMNENKTHTKGIIRIVNKKKSHWKLKTSWRITFTTIFAISAFDSMKCLFFFRVDQFIPVSYELSTDHSVYFDDRISKK